MMLDSCPLPRSMTVSPEAPGKGLCGSLRYLWNEEEVLPFALASTARGDVLRIVIRSSPLGSSSVRKRISPYRDAVSPWSGLFSPVPLAAEPNTRISLPVVRFLIMGSTFSKAGGMRVVHINQETAAL
jgi:hypothetical protein